MPSRVMGASGGIEPSRLALRILHNQTRSTNEDARGGLGFACALAVLLRRFLRADAADPLWPDRDRLLLGPGASALAAAFADAAGSPSLADTLPQGHALGMALGAALAERLLAARFGRSLVDHHTWLLADSAELHGGSAREALFLAGRLRCERLIVIAQAPPDEAAGRALCRSLRDAGWGVREVEPQPVSVDAACAAVAASISAALRARRPSFILCPPILRAAQGDGPTPGPAPGPWGRGLGRAAARRGWLKRLARSAQRQDFLTAQAGRPVLPQWAAAAGAAGPPGAMAAPADAIAWLRGVAEALPGIAGFAEGEVPPLPFRDIDWQGQDRARGDALCGMALHGGLFPVLHMQEAGAAALLPCLQLAARRGLRMAWLLAEPAGAGPQSLSALWRAVPGVHVLRPADAAETEECLSLALRHLEQPCVLLLAATECTLPPPERRGGCAAGGYLRRSVPAPQATLVASGTELAAAAMLAEASAALGLDLALVSLPCWDLFAARDRAYQENVLGTAPRLVIEPQGSATASLAARAWAGGRGTVVSVPAGQSPEASQVILRGALAELLARHAPGADAPLPGPLEIARGFQ